jgi:Na+-transporting NADH:ubiquinone oxidoreductase subunit C
VPDTPAKRDRNSLGNTVLVALGVSFVCSVVVSAAAIALKPQQEQNRDEYRQRIVLEVAGLYEPGQSVASLFGNVETRIVDLATGEYADDIDAASFDPLAAATDPAQSSAIASAEDSAGIGRRAKYAPVYLIREDGALHEIILPVYGKGLWSTMYGYLALAPDGQTIRGLRFYEHGETPGLGDQVDKPAWRALWDGKQAYGSDGEPRVAVIKGTVRPGPDADYEVDGLAGATLTGRGVTNLLHYWLGPQGFGPYLEQFHPRGVEDG